MSGACRAGSRTTRRGGRKGAATSARRAGSAGAWRSYVVLRSSGVCRSWARRTADRKADQSRQRLSSTTVMDMASRQRQISAPLPLSPITQTVWHAARWQPRTSKTSPRAHPVPGATFDGGGQTRRPAPGRRFRTRAARPTWQPGSGSPGGGRCERGWRGRRRCAHPPRCSHPGTTEQPTEQKRPFWPLAARVRRRAGRL